MEQFNETIRPDVELLKQGLPLSNPKFRSSSFWGPAQDLNGIEIPNGYKMKWHNMGNGRNQLRLTVAIMNERAYLCHAYLKQAIRKTNALVQGLKTKLKISAMVQLSHEVNYEPSQKTILHPHA